MGLGVHTLINLTWKFNYRTLFYFFSGRIFCIKQKRMYIFPHGTPGISVWHEIELMCRRNRRELQCFCVV